MIYISPPSLLYFTTVSPPSHHYLTTISPLSRPQNTTIHYWIDAGADRRKLVLGMPMYGQSFTLSQANQNTLAQKSYGGGEAGPYTRARGFLAYYEVRVYTVKI